ncbi:hypothetical protein SHELI_v1c02610 [Spiroplasma helicoides]|uniref:DnaD N-terminal domain-containing protein n=1 Tax=Spiroplasma helicoides TaxID=216938 RepID=A0A1B3SJV4_9MOLU|nr:DnaD family protein [Spiroplasma helicoides]AOG60216.1 hypothetical protein SHELI_v1c02610 [Spiroplasma helicoides]
MFHLFKAGIISKRTLLILNYSKLSINENQLAIILIIMELSNDEQKNFTPSEIAKYMSIEKDLIEQEISKLLVDGLISIEQVGKKTQLDLLPLFNKLIFKLEEESASFSHDKKFVFVEQLMSIKLSAEEVAIIEDYVKKGLSKTKMVSLITEKKIKDFTGLVKELDNYLAKTKTLKLTRYNWLND